MFDAYPAQKVSSAEARGASTRLGRSKFLGRQVDRRSALSLAGVAAMSAGLNLTSSAAAAPLLEPMPLAVTGPKAASGPTRIHVMAFAASDAIILESRGRFAFVDSGEDNEFPDGSDPRYPVRAGTTMHKTGYEEIMWSYLDSLGVKPGTVDFYLGTHPHSDHIGLAGKIIERYRPERVYTPEYDDAWISESARLWDNLYVYDKLLAATKKVGAHLIQHLDPKAPLEPTGSAPNTACPVFDFGDMHIEIVNYEEDYKRPGAVFDANLFTWGAKVTAHGCTAFLSGDIENTDGDEDKLAPIIGHVDFLKLGHHGLCTSNSRAYLQALRPSIAFQTGNYTYMHEPALRTLNEMGTRWYPAEELRAVGKDAFVVTLSPGGIKATTVGSQVFYRYRPGPAPHVTAYQEGRPAVQNGWRSIWGTSYWFDHSASAAENTWVQDKGSWYYLAHDGAMATGWVKDRGTWYYLAHDGAMATGWVKDRGTWYYLEASGAMATGWRQLGGVWYYLHPNGAMATGWVKDSGSWYYLRPSGAMATGTTITNGRTSRFSRSGAWLGYIR